MINIRQKGANGEREICKALNDILIQVMTEMQFPQEEILKARNAIQRNQNQSAVGGNDLSNTFGLSIEVKRQEQLAVNTWWKQCIAAAQRNNEVPVLLYRQNGKKWKCMTTGYVSLPGHKYISATVEFTWEVFLSWFRMWVREKLLQGERVSI